MFFRRVARRIFPAVASLAFFLGRERVATAYCRLTTCDQGSGKNCLKNDSGCIREGVPLVWKTSPIVYRFSAAGSSKLDKSSAREVIRRAFGEWENVQCSRGRTSLRFKEGPDIGKNKPIGKNKASEPFGIYFRDTQWSHDDADESLALTYQTYGEVTGTIDYADIEINTAEVEFSLTDAETGGTDLQAVVTHEVGHYIGLAHSLDADSIMVARYCQNNTTRCAESIDKKRGLADDDIRAVCVLYEPPRAPTPESSGCRTSSEASSPMSSREVLGAGALSFVAVALVRRRRRG